MKIAYIVFLENGMSSFTGTEHDLMLQFLQGKGLDIHLEEWTNENADWKSHDCIVLKSPWNYVDNTQLFYQWLDTIESLHIPLLNPADVVRWNSDKHYLPQIAAAGSKVIPTSYLEQGASFNAVEFLQAFNATAIIVKPCISGSSKNTFKVSAANDEHTPAINELLQHGAMMVQPFMPQVNEEGEWSLVFFGGKFSHALIKTPSANEFRSQSAFGGVVTAKVPAPGILQSATEYVLQFAKGCLYARVDGLVVDGEFFLMELELLDPYLFLSTHAEGYENYYVALTNCLNATGLLQN